MRRHLRQGVLAAAEADFQPEFVDAAAKSGTRLGRQGWIEPQARQRLVQQLLLPRT
jgi:hypothetical protein